MAIRKSKVKQWALKLNDGRFSSPETLVWEIAARGELSIFTVIVFVTAGRADRSLGHQHEQGRGAR
eukprot:10145196-Heterocapsa_arctica.AAC.1